MRCWRFSVQLMDEFLQAGGRSQAGETLADIGRWLVILHRAEAQNFRSFIG